MKKTNIIATLKLILIVLFVVVEISGLMLFISSLNQINKDTKAFINDPVNQYEVTSLIVTRKVEAIEPTMKEWVKAEVEKNGLDWNQVDCLIHRESGWNPWAYNISNDNNTTDFGLWQINSIHKKTATVECRWDYKCATKWAIAKRLHDGNWSAWYGFNKFCK